MKTADLALAVLCLVTTTAFAVDSKTQWTLVDSTRLVWCSQHSSSSRLLASLLRPGVTPAQAFQFVVSFRHSLHVHRFLFGVFFP